MPNSLVKSYAEKTGKSDVDVEAVYRDTEEKVMFNKKYKKLPKDRKYAIINSVVQKRLGINEEELNEGDDRTKTSKEHVADFKKNNPDRVRPGSTDKGIARKLRKGYEAHLKIEKDYGLGEELDSLIEEAYKENLMESIINFMGKSKKADKIEKEKLQKSEDEASRKELSQRQAAASIHIPQK